MNDEKSPDEYASKISGAYLEQLSDQCTDLFLVAERRLSLGRRFSRCRVWEKSGSRGATIEGGEEKTIEYTDELTTISTVAPRLDNHSPLNRR